jgi:preprotein translocase subunit YajC
LAANSSGGSSLPMIGLFVLMIIAMYFLLIRPQQKRKREAQNMQNTVGVGAEVMTIGGLYGTIVEVDGDTITLEVDEGITNKYARGAISRVVTPAPEETAEDEDVDGVEDVDDELEVDEEPEVEEQAEPAVATSGKKAAKDEVPATTPLPRDPTAN